MIPAGGRWAALGEVIDAVVATDFTARGFCVPLYQAARKVTDYPLAMGAALLLQDRVRRGDPVLIATGWPARSWLVRGLTETDGPVGAAYLARMLEQCLGAVPVLVMEESLAHFGETALRAAGLIVSDVRTAVAAKNGPHNASVGAVLPFTADAAAAESEAGAVFDRLHPAAVVGIEVPGADAGGRFHNVTARTVPTELVVKADALCRAASKRGALSIGIGDGGNELGMGNIAGAVGELLGEQIAPVTAVDHLVVGSISNWAAIGVGAALCAVTGRPEIMATVDVMRITERLCDAGAIDGLTSYVDPKNDGTERATNLALVELLRTAVGMHLRGWEKG